MEHKVRREGKRSYSPEERKEYSDKLLVMTFGKLRQQVYQKFGLSQEFLAVMQTGKDQRDDLAHNFWIHHLGNLRSRRGLRIIFRHCRVIERQIDGVADYLIQQTGIDAWGYIGFVKESAQDHAKHEDWEALLATAEAAFTPTIESESHLAP